MEKNVCMTEKENYKFIPVEKLSCVCELSEIQENPDKVYQFFLENEDEVLYVTKNGSMYGLITIGDMFKYYRQKCRKRETPINQQFSYVESAKDYAEAETFFARVSSIHEIPVIKEKKLLGVIKNYFFSSEREKLRYSLIIWKNQYHIEKIKLFARLCHTVLIQDPYDMHKYVTSHLTEDIRQLFKYRRSYGELKEYKTMTKIERRCYLENYFKEKGSEKFIQPILDQADLEIFEKNGIYRYKDCHNETFHCVNGHRKTPNAPDNAMRKIWMLGPCIIFGYYVKDAETIEYYLQELLINHGFGHYEVVNCGMRDYLEVLFTEPISHNDIVVIFNGGLGGGMLFDEVENIHCIWDFTDIYMENIDIITEHVFNDPLHCDAFLNEQIAGKMYEGISQFLAKDAGDAVPEGEMPDYYISLQIFAYYELYRLKHQLQKEPDKKTGAIVMNCNPYTYGHRYLIEQACGQVDKLYIFVVEEDKSYFRFEDRLEMVKLGTADLDKVQVLPSGKYIISQDTFAQYFTKDQIFKEIDDMDYDVRIFGEVVADILGISCRFVGEEPFDKVTKKYNETMKLILPEYNVDVIEIPRKEMNGNVISASMVRKYMEQGELDKVRELVPESTVDVCRRYIAKLLS